MKFKKILALIITSILVISSFAITEQKVKAGGIFSDGFFQVGVGDQPLKVVWGDPDMVEENAITINENQTFTLRYNNDKSVKIVDMTVSCKDGRTLTLVSENLNGVDQIIESRHYVEKTFRIDDKTIDEIYVAAKIYQVSVNYPDETNTTTHTIKFVINHDSSSDFSGNGWKTEDGNDYWYEDGVKQGTQGRGKEIYDPETDAWYWLDSFSGGQIAKSKDVYQESKAGIFGDNKVYKEDGTIDVDANTGKWVRYDSDGHMVKGWSENSNGKYYFDMTYGTMAKGYATIDGKEYYFNPDTGVLEREITDGISGDFTGWKNIDGADYWYENGVRQGYSTDVNYRGKEIFDSSSNAWYWLDNVDGGRKAVNKDVFQESQADDNGNKGKWVRYDGEGHMIKGWSADNNYYFDFTYGTMYKGWHNIDGTYYYFDEVTGVRS